MKLADKIVRLRKSMGLSQEELAEKLDVSRQAVSRWEIGTATPDATNILQLSKLFHVTTDYLLYEEYESDSDLPKVKEVKKDGMRLIMICLIAMEIMVFIIQFMCTVILQSVFFSISSWILFIALISGFEFGYQKKKQESTGQALRFRKRFYQISAWIGTYFPVRLLVMALAEAYPRPLIPLVMECIVCVIYLMVSMLITLTLEKRCLPKD